MLWTVSRKRKRTGLQSEDLIEFVSMAPMYFWITFLKSPGVSFFKWYVCKIKQVLLWNWTKSDCVSESNCMSSCNFLLSIYSYSCSTGEREKYYYLFSCSVVSKTFVTPWTVALQDALSTGFLRQEYWSGLPFHPPGDLPDTGPEPVSSALQVDSLSLNHQGSPHYYY